MAVKKSTTPARKSAAKVAKNRDEIIPQVVDVAPLAEAVTRDTLATNSYLGSGATLTRGELPTPDSITIQGLGKFAPLLNIDPFDPSSAAAAGHVAMSKEDYTEHKENYEGYQRNMEIVGMGYDLIKRTLQTATKAVGAKVASIDYAIAYQGIETSELKLEIAQSQTMVEGHKRDAQHQIEQFTASENITKGQMLSMKLRKLALLAEQQAHDLQLTRQQTQSLTGAEPKN